MLKLAIFDLDHTLLNDDKTLSKVNQDAIQKLKNQGVIIACATGRNEMMARPFARKIGVNGPLIINNGALLKDFESGNILYERPLEKPDQAFVIDYALEHDLNYVVYTDEGVITTRKDRLSVYQGWNQAHPSDKLTYQQSDDRAVLKAKKAYKILLIIEDEATITKVKADLVHLNDIAMIKSSQTFLDVMHRDVDKAEALKRYCTYAKIPLKDVIAFGDNDNDAAMLKQVGYGFAMKNGTSMAKAHADYITEKPHDQNGVADILNQLDTYLKYDI